MKSLFRKILAYICILLSGIGVTGCSLHEYPDSGNAELRLLLKVSVAEPGDVSSESESTRADDVYFEQPELDCEKLHSLRVIIVESKTGVIVHNYFENFNKSVTKTTLLPLEVEFATDYEVYLIGNESGITGLDYSDIFNVQLAQGKVYPENLLENLKLSASVTGAPIITNSTGSVSLIPMSEKFSLRTIDHPVGVEEIKVNMEKEMFLTRAASKFTFNFFKSADYNGDNSLRIKGIKISGLGTEEYLIPSETVYSPDKYEVSENPYKGRLITSFGVPEDNAVGDYIFSIPSDYQSRFIVENLPVQNPDNPKQVSVAQYSPTLYFPETLGNSGEDKFQCSITFDGKEYMPAITLPNLPSLPRNTHVIVNIVIGNEGALFFRIIVEPWTSRYYEVDFSTNVGIADDGTLTFDENTYAAFNKETGRLVLRDFPQITTGSFGISSPIGGRWYAYLVTTAGDQGVIQFQTVDEAGNKSTSSVISGNIDGTKTTFNVVTTQAAGEEMCTAVLQVMVTLPNGLSVPVNILKSSEYGAGVEYITFIQNPK